MSEAQAAAGEAPTEEQKHDVEYASEETKNAVSDHLPWEVFIKASKCPEMQIDQISAKLSAIVTKSD